MSEIATKPQETPSADYRILDLVRSIAVLLVVVRHVFEFTIIPENRFFQLWPFGTSGVLIFFVHTSLVLMFSLQRSEAKEAVSGAKFYGSFMVRRIFRIYPLSIITILLAAFVFQVGMSASQNAPAILANLALVQSFTGHENVLVPLWSLPLEMGMYLLLPLFFFVLKKGKVGAAVGLTACAFVGAYLGHKFQWNEFFAYAPSFMGGILAYSLWFKTKRVLPWWVVPIYLFLGVIAFMALYAKTGIRGVGGAPMCVGLGVLLAFVRDLPEGKLSHVSFNIAKYSYGIYLFHELFFRYFALRVFHLPEGVQVPLSESAPPLVLGLLATGVCSYVAFHYLEQPMIRLGQRLAARLRASFPADKAQVG